MNGDPRRIVRVFLSSTTRDLPMCRQVVRDAIEGLDGFHCLAMERFGARDADARTFDDRMISESDLMIGILGHVHGSTPPDDARSFTELEYEAAVQAGVPRLMFLASDDFPAPPNLVEPEPRRLRQRAFRARVGGDRICETFRSDTELVGAVLRAVRNWERQRAGAALEEAPVWTLTVPRLPEPDFAHPYPLQEHFTGRGQARDLLTGWYRQDGPPVMVLVGIGGMGKSALSWVWVNEDVLGGARLTPAERPAGVLWWSFYEPGSDFLSFLHEALVYLSEGRIDTSRVPAPHNQARLVVALLQQRRFLVILDGLERLLRAYGGMDATWQGDLDCCPVGEDPNACVSPLAGHFLAWLAAARGSSRILVTSRLFPADLSGWGGEALPGCLRYDLASLAPDDAVAFFRVMGVRGSRAEIRGACEPYGYHPLTLRLLCGYVVHHPVHPGDLAMAARVDFVEQLRRRRPSVLDLAFSALRPPTRALLCRIAAFRSTMRYGVFEAISPIDDPADLERAVDELVARGLLLHDARRATYDLHPIIRRHAYGLLTDKTDVHTRLTRFLQAALAPPTGEVPTFEELEPIIELFQHLARAGLHEDAFKLYNDRLRKPLDRLGRFQEEAACLEMLLPPDPEGPLLTGNHRVIVANIAVSWGYLGRPDRARELCDRVWSQYSKGTSHPDASLGNRAYFELVLGLLERAWTSTELALSRWGPQAASDGVYNLLHKGLLLSLSGDYDRSREVLGAVLRAAQKDLDLPHWIHAWCYRAMRAEMMGDPDLALTCARRALRLARELGHERIALRARMLVGRALTALVGAGGSRGQMLRAEHHLDEGLSQCRRLNMVELEVDFLLGWATFHRVDGNLAQAQTDAQQALYLADRCAYRLKQAEIRLELARIWKALGDPVMARTHAEQARERAWCDGPPHCYRAVLDAAELLLRDFGAGEPVPSGR